MHTARQALPVDARGIANDCNGPGAHKVTSAHILRHGPKPSQQRTPATGRATIDP